VTSSAPWHWSGNPFVDLAQSDDTRNLLNQMSANLAAAFGAEGFFSARPLTPWFQPGGTLASTSFYDTKQLKDTLERLVDFDRLNAGMTRFSAGAVNVRSGNFVYCTGHFKNVHRVQRALDALLRRLPADFEETDDLKILKSVASDKVHNIIQLIYRARNYEGHSKDYEFSRLSMQDHWRAGYHDAVRTLRHPDVLARPTSLDGVFTFDLERDGRE
jgi:predicted acylesterase/phospholipase RssA